VSLIFLELTLLLKTKHTLLGSVTHRTSDIYTAEVDFVLEKGEDPRDFTFNIPSESRKRLVVTGTGRSQNFIDILGFLCTDPTDRPVFIFSFQRLQPHESRAISVMRTSSSKSKLSAKTGFFTLVPQALSAQDEEAGRAIRFSQPKNNEGCRVFTFLMDRDGPYWFGSQGGKF